MYYQIENPAKQFALCTTGPDKKPLVVEFFDAIPELCKAFNAYANTRPETDLWTIDTRTGRVRTYMRGYRR